MSNCAFQKFVFNVSSSKNEILVYKDMKPNRRTFFEVYTDTTFLVSGIITEPGLHIPNKLHNWFNLPKTKDDKSIIVSADYLFSNCKKYKKYLKTKSEIYNNNYGTYIRPNNVTCNNSKAIEKFQQGEMVSCKISFDSFDRGFVIKDDYKETLSFIQNASLDLMSVKLIISGSNYNSNFDIYINSENNIIIRHKGLASHTNNLTLSTEINKYIDNLFDSNHKFLCKINNEFQLIVDSSIIHNKEKGLKKTILLPYTNSSKTVEILIMNPQLRLSKIAIENYNMRVKLRRIGLPIISFKQNTSPKSNHVNAVFETQVRGLIKKLISNLDGERFSEVKLVRESRVKGNISTTKYYVDELGLIDLDEEDTKFLIIIEIKSSIPKRQKSHKIDTAISKIINFSKKLNSTNVVPILIVNEDFRFNNEIITSEYGSRLNMILIGQSEFQYFLENPKALIQKIKSFCLKEKNSSQKENRNDNFIASIVANNVLSKHKEILSKTITEEAKVIGTRRYSGKGMLYEKCIAKKYKLAGYDVVTNLLVQLYKRKMELDLLIIKEKEVVLVSCKDMSSVVNLDYLTIRIREAANLIEHRTELLGIQKANVHIKTNPQVFNKINDKFNGNWSSKINIYIEK